MTFKEYQKLAQETAIYPGKGENICYPALGLNGEAWELFEKVKRQHFYKKENRDGIIKEIGDCLWYVQEIAFETKIDLSGEWNQPAGRLAILLAEEEIEDEVEHLNIYAGAVAEMAKKQMRDDAHLDKDRLESYLIICVNFLKEVSANILKEKTDKDLALAHVAQLNIQKLKTRKANGTIKGSGDDR